MRDHGVRGPNAAQSASVRVMFRFPGSLASGAKRVLLVGSFNAWNPEAHRLTKNPDGDWTIAADLAPGRVVYRFDVDGSPRLDPDGEALTLDGAGSECSVRYVRPVHDGTPVPHPPRERHSRLGGAPPPLECGIEELPEAVVLRPRGDVDLATLPTLRDRLKDAVERGRHVIVDMSGVDYMDSTGIHALCDHHGLCRERGRLLVLAAVRSPVSRVVGITELDKIIPMFPSVETAVTALAPHPPA